MQLCISIERVKVSNPKVILKDRKKKLKIPKGKSKAVNRKRTNNTIAKWIGQKDTQWSGKHYTEN